MSNLISLPFKQTEVSHFWAALNDAFKDLSVSDSELYDQELRASDNLRQKISSEFNKNTEPIISSSFLDSILEFYSQLNIIKDKIAPNQLNFCWGNSFARDQEKICSTDFVFELSNILYNIGAALSQLGSNESRNTSEGIVTSCRYFQEAAGSFKLLQEHLHVSNAFPLENINADLDFYSLEFNNNLMLAQAQECTWQKATLNKMSSKACSQLAGHVSVLYNQALEAASRETTRDLIPESILLHLRVKSLHFKAVSHYRFSLEFKENNNISLELSHLRFAESKISEAKSILASASRSEISKNLESLENVVSQNLSRALKYNNWVHYQAVPVTKDSIPTRLMVEAKVSNRLTSYENELHAKNITPMMSYLKPYIMYQAPKLYESRKTYFIETALYKPIHAIIDEYDNLTRNSPIQELINYENDTPNMPLSLLKQLDRISVLGGIEGLESKSISLLNLRDETKSLLNYNIAKILAIFQKLDQLPELPQEAIQLRPKIKLFQDRFLDASKADEGTFKSIKSNKEVFTSLTNLKADTIKNSQELDLSGIDKETILKEYKVLLSEKDKAVQKCNSCIKEILSVSSIDDITETIDLLSLNEYSNCANTDDIDQVISKELKKYSRFQNIIAEQQRLLALSKERHTALLNSIHNSPKTESDTVNSGYFKYLTEASDEYERLFSALEAGFKFYKLLQDRVAAFYTDCERVYGSTC